MTGNLPPAASIPAHVRAFLGAPRVATVGTAGADGEPHQTVLWYRLDADDRILLNSSLPRRWPADILRDGRVSLAVIDENDGYRWVGLSGTVETVIDDVETARDDICALAARYDDTNPTTLAAFRAQQRISFRIRITRIHDHLGNE